MKGKPTAANAGERLQSTTKPGIVDDGLAKIREAQSFLGVGRSKVYDLMDSGHLMYCKIGKSRLIPRQALRQFAAACLHGGVQEA